MSIPDQRKQGEAYCTSRGYQLVETYVEPGASATNDRRPEFQKMIEAGTAKPTAFDVVIVHSFSRFFRDHFELEFYVRKLAKNGVRLVSMTQELGDDPMHIMMRQIMALFAEYQSKENAKHTLRALKENARQGFWNGSLPPIGYRVVDAEKRGAKVKKKLEIDPLHADTVRLAFKLALEGDGVSGRMGVKSIAKHHNERKIYTRSGRRWGVGAVHRILTWPTYIGRLDRRQERAERRACHATELRKKAAEADARLKRLYDAIESGVADTEDESLKERIAELRALKSQAQVDAERATIALDAVGAEITQAKLRTFADAARRRLRGPDGGYRRDHLRALAQRVEVADVEVRIMGSRGNLLRTLTAAGGVICG